jgi:hypothetical protein
MAVNLEKRVAMLEQQVARLQSSRQSNSPTDRGWLDDLYGSFASDPIFEHAMKLGRQYRKSLRPAPRKGNRKR